LAELLNSHTGRALSRTDFIPYLSDLCGAGGARTSRMAAKHNLDRPERLAEALPRLSKRCLPKTMPMSRRSHTHAIYSSRTAIEDAGEQCVYSIRSIALHSFVANGFVITIPNVV